MKPVLFSINGIDIPAITIFWVLGFIVFGYFLSKRFKNIKNVNLGFDIVIMTMVLSIVLGRVFFVFKNWGQYKNDWTFLPVQESIDGISWFQSMPWTLAAFWEPKVNFGMIMIAVFLAGMFFYGLNKLKLEYTNYWSNLWMGFIPAMIIFSVGYLLDGTYYGKPSELPFSIVYKIDGSARFAIQIIEIIGLMLIWAFYLDRIRFRNFSQKLLVIAFPILFFAMKIILWFESGLYQKQFWIFDTFQIFWILAIILVLFDYLVNLVLFRRSSETSQKARQSRSIIRGKNYNQSFSRYQRNNKFQLFKTDAVSSRKV